MAFLVATNVIASQLPERRPTRLATARATRMLVVGDIKQKLRRIFLWRRCDLFS